MSKLLSSVLDKISEDNNSYRMELRDLNKTIDEKTTALVGDVVTLSNYTVDFSNAVTNAKEKLVNPISRIIESYVIKDLRSVETVNEQFVDKINDKIENSNINNDEDRENFIKNLNSLLNDKYLEIVKIKRIDFLNTNGINDDVENCIIDFTNYLKSVSTFDDSRLNELMNAYKFNLYSVISQALLNISNIYLDNFVNGISDALNVSLDTNDLNIEPSSNEGSFKPYIPEMNPVPEIEIPVVPEVPAFTEIEVPQTPQFNEPEINEKPVFIEPEVPEIPNLSELEIPKMVDVAEEKVIDMPLEQPAFEEVNMVPSMDIPEIAPIEITVDKKVEEPKKKYDVEEILKIAKSPIVTMPVEEKKTSNDYLSVSLINNKEEVDSFESDVDEKEIVEEMIKRLTKRLSIINERQEKYDEAKRKLEEDEAFVNDLIESSNNKRNELDKLENELDDKEKEIKERQKELDKKINDVMPFAKAIMKSNNEEA